MESNNQFEMWFHNYQTKEYLIFSVNGLTSTIQIACDNIQDLGLMVQDIAEYNNIKDLESSGRFPRERIALKENLSRI